MRQQLVWGENCTQNLGKKNFVKLKPGQTLKEILRIMLRLVLLNKLRWWKLKKTAQVHVQRRAILLAVVIAEGLLPEN